MLKSYKLPIIKVFKIKKKPTIFQALKNKKNYSKIKYSEICIKGRYFYEN